MRFIKRALLVIVVVLAVLLSPYALLFGWWTVKAGINSYRADAFYAEHKLLSDLRAATKIVKGPINPDAARKAAFHKYVPVGSTKAQAIEALSTHGLLCRRRKPSSGEHAVQCSLSPQPDFVLRWLIQMTFNEEGKLMYADVTTPKSSEPAY